MKEIVRHEVLQPASMLLECIICFHDGVVVGHNTGENIAE